MSVIADLVRAGVDPELVARVAEEIAEARAQGARDAAPSLTLRQQRNARYYVAHRDELKAKREASKTSENVLNQTSKTHGTPSPKERSPTPPKEITPSPSSLRSVSYRAREAFGEFWATYPRRDGSNPKQPAEQKFVRLVEAGTDPAEITAGARRYAAAVAGEDPRFVAQAVTWLNQGRWRDDHVPPARAGPAGNRPRGPTMAEMARMDEPGFSFDDPRPDSRDSTARTTCDSVPRASGFVGRLSLADREERRGQVVDL